MKNIFWYKVGPNERAFTQPWYLGLSYVDFYKNDIYLTIMPLNLIIRGIVKFWNWMKFGK